MTNETYMVLRNPICIFLAIALSICIGCQPREAKQEQHTKEVMQENRVKTTNPEVALEDTIYVPVYSEIYNRTKDVSFLLTATLSVRNTSFRDSIYINRIDYYNTNGEMVRSYLSDRIFLKPMETIDYVVDEADETGGSGANFIIAWSAKNKNVTPVFQAVMISTSGQQGVAFTTEGVSISSR